MEVYVDSNLEYTWNNNTSLDVYTSSTNITNYVSSMSDSIYTLDNTNSYCTTDNGNGEYIRNDSVTIGYSDLNLSINNNSGRKAKCYLYFDERPDETAPTTTIAVSSSTSGSNGWYRSLTLRVSGSDSESGVASVQYCTTTSTTCTPNMSVTGTSTTVSLSSNASARRVCARSTDNAGNVSEVTCSNAYSVDSTNPTISITSTSVTSNSITVTVRGSDSHSGIYQYKFSSNNGSSYTTITSSNGTYSYTFNNLNDDTTYTIAVQSVDRAGNTSSKVTKNVTAEDPQTITQMLAGYNNQQEVILVHHIQRVQQRQYFKQPTGMVQPITLREPQRIIMYILQDIIGVL